MWRLRVNKSMERMGYLYKGYVLFCQEIHALNITFNLENLIIFQPLFAILLILVQYGLSCLAAIPRFRFDSCTGKCEFFIWGGCGGNATNNFRTKEECEERYGGIYHYEMMYE